MGSLHDSFSLVSVWMCFGAQVLVFWVWDSGITDDLSRHTEFNHLSAFLSAICQNNSRLLHLFWFIHVLFPHQSVIPCLLSKAFNYKFTWCLWRLEIIWKLFFFSRILVLAVPSTVTDPDDEDEDEFDDSDESAEADDDGRIYKNPRNSPSSDCPRDEEQATLLGQKCLRKCSSHEDCKSKKKKCLCDGTCGMSCIKPGIRKKRHSGVFEHDNNQIFFRSWMSWTTTTWTRWGYIERTSIRSKSNLFLSTWPQRDWGTFPNYFFIPKISYWW